MTTPGPFYINTRDLDRIMNADQKTYTAVGMAGTKRRRHVAGFAGGQSALSRRVTKLQRTIKAHHPTHLRVESLGVTFGNVSNSGTLYDICSAIAQGDDYNNRFSSTTRSSRLVFRGILSPGAGSTIAELVRITVFKAQSGLVFAANTTGSYSPIVTGTSMWTYFDKFYTVPPSSTAYYFPVNLNFSVAIKQGKKRGHLQKYSGTGAGTTTGDSVYVIIQAGVGAGAGAPIITGTLEHYFDPL